MSPGSAKSGPQITRVEALAAADAAGRRIAPAALLLEAEAGRGCRLLAVGTPELVRQHPASEHARAVLRPSSVLLPGLVNAHTHLDLTGIGPRPHDPRDGFVPWVEMIRQGRPETAAGIVEAVREGITLNLRGGTVAVGDIAGAPLGKPRLEPLEALSSSRLLGVSFVEFFGMGKRALESDRVAALAAQVLERNTGEAWGVRAGLQPHAPNTVDLRLFLRCAALGLPLSTHLAETPEERAFVGQARGPQREFLERLGLWDETITQVIGRGLHPVEHLKPALAAARFIAAHVNDCDEAAIQTLAKTGTTVAYCPRASAYFGAERAFGPHRYREMLRAGVNVALGTDSVVNLPAEDVDRRGISVLDEMRLLFERDGADPDVLLRMGTINGGRALGLPDSAFTFEPDSRLAGLIAVEVERHGEDPLVSVLRSRGGVEMLACGLGLCDG